MIEIEEYLKSGSLTLVVGQKRDLLHDKQFLQEEVIGKLDNMLEYMDRFSNDVVTLLDSNQSLGKVLGILSSLSHLYHYHHHNTNTTTTTTILILLLLLSLL